MLLMGCSSLLRELAALGRTYDAKIGNVGLAQAALFPCWRDAPLWLVLIDFARHALCSTSIFLGTSLPCRPFERSGSFLWAALLFVMALLNSARVYLRKCLGSVLKRVLHDRWFLLSLQRL
jgi:hypothetical protein